MRTFATLCFVLAAIWVAVSASGQSPGELGDRAYRTLTGWYGAVRHGRELPPVAQLSGPPVMYRYVDSHGRSVYTNVEEQVPLDQRMAAKLDLTHVSLNAELGTEIDHRLREEHVALTKSPYCRGLREAAEENLLLYAWRNSPALVMCAGIFAALALLTPIAIKRFGAPAWAKTLTTVIPMITLTGLVSFGLMKSNAALRRVKQEAQPCSEEAFTQLSSELHPVQKHAELLNRLKQQMAQIDAESR